MPAWPRFARRAGAPERVLRVEHGDAVHEVRLKRVAAARRFTLRVRAADGLAVLTMPTRATLGGARAFAERNAAWIGARLAALPARVPLVPGEVVPLRGVAHPIALDPRALRRVRALAAAEGGPALLVSPRAPDPAAAVLAFLRAQARADLAAAAARHAAAVGRPIGRIALRDTRSRWGSCSSRGALNFSWRLILAPPVVLDYLAAHEVAHLVHLDHSDAFWRLARALAPRTDEAEAWLRAHGPGLHRYGTAR